MKVYKHWSQYPLASWRWKNFTPQEVACRDGSLAINETAMDRLQALRDLLGVPLRINSAYRSPPYNKKVGGAARSKHLEAKAYDVAMANHDPALFEAAARKAGFTGFGFYPRYDFIHIDIGPARSWGKRWFEKWSGPLPPPAPPTSPMIPEEVVEVINDADKPVLASTTSLAAIGQVASTAGGIAAALQGIDWRVAIAFLTVGALLGFYIIRERMRRADLARKARGA